MPPKIVNPYARRHKVPKATTEMGPQSQRRRTLEERKHLFEADPHNFGNSIKRKNLQLTLEGEVAFDPIKHCEICKPRHYGLSEPHRAHHPLCCNNKRTKGLPESELARIREEKRLKNSLSRPLTDAEKASSENNTPEAFARLFGVHQGATEYARAQLMKPTKTGNPRLDFAMDHSIDFCEEVSNLVADPSFAAEYPKCRAPLPLIAFAKAVRDQIILKGKVEEYFTGMTMSVPTICDKKLYDNPQYHSIVGQKLVLVDWTRHGVSIPCTRCSNGVMKNDRTNFSKNKQLFPIFGMDGPPSWCMYYHMECSSCKSRLRSIDSEIMAGIPFHLSSLYPVETKYCINSTFHLARSATDVLDLLMPTYGNGDLCARILYNTINRVYLERVGSYYSYHALHKSQSVKTYPAKDGEYITQYPPLGETVRDVYDKASNNECTPWGFSDYERHTREIQSVKCKVLFAQDHTHEVTKNYFHKKKNGAQALWDVATETGEIACAILVPSTKTADLSHAALQLSRRESFNPKVMYSDTWPAMDDYWKLLFHGLEGRLGLFHYLQRIIKTMRHRHIDYYRALNMLLDAVYFYNKDDYENLLTALKSGNLSSTGRKYTDSDIASMKQTKLFRQRYNKYLRKEIHPVETLREKLMEWHAAFKCSASNDSTREALGRVDPITKETLFTPATKDAVRNCCEKAQYLQDPLPLEEMYDVIVANPNSKHGLNEYLSRRGESNLESFHLLLAHFGNCGMRDRLADTLNLTGTARHNITIRHKLRLAMLPTDEATLELRRKIPAAWETIIAYYNHSELAFINNMAMAAGVRTPPFQAVETLVTDTGERFFSSYLHWLSSAKPKVDSNNICLCCLCNAKDLEQPPSIPLALPPPDEDTAMDTNTFELTLPPKQQQQQQTLQQQQQQQSIAANQMLWPMPVPMPFINPMWPIWQNQLLFNQQQTWCCSKYREYCLRADKRGRPPHDRNCNQRNNII